MDDIPVELRNRIKSEWCNYAVNHSDLKLLQWARTHGAPWDESTCANAAEYGHLEVLKWARSHSAPWNT